MASIVGNLNLARNKVLEAVAETTAPLRPTEDLLADISTFGAVKPAKRSDETRETKQAPKQRLQEVKFLFYVNILLFFSLILISPLHLVRKQLKGRHYHIC